MKRSEDTNETIARLRRNIKITAVLMSLTVMFMAAVTIAWFASNRKVDASQAQVTAGVSTDALYITNTSAEDWKTEVSAAVPEDERGLFPISTADAVHWYYPTTWELMKDETAPLGVNMMATGYSEASCEMDTAGVVASYTATGEHGYSIEVSSTGGTSDGTGTSDGNGTSDDTSSQSTAAPTRTAYYKQSYTIYSGEGSYDIYLEPEGLITVEYADGVEADEQKKADADILKSSIRIAITAVETSGGTQTETLKLYYIPETESGSGNSYVAAGTASDSGTSTGDTGDASGASTSATVAGQTYAIYPPDSTSTVPYIKKITSAALTDYAATSAGISQYTAEAGKTSFGRAGAGTANGLHLNMYVWLEGTDAQTLVGETTSIPAVLNVKASFAGVEASD